MKKILRYFVNVDRRIIYVVIFLSVLLPFLIDFDMPVKPDHNVMAMYNRIETMAVRNETLLISFDFDNASKAEIEPMARAIIAHAFSRNVKVVAMGQWANGVELSKSILFDLSKEYKKEYGKDWAYLGWKPSSFPGVVIMNLGKNFRSAYEVDYKGVKLSEMLVTRDIHTLKDFGYIISLSAGNYGIDDWVAYGQTRFNVDVGGGSTAVGAPDFFPYLQSGQLKGLISGLVGAAQYEILIGRKGQGYRGMRPQSVAHLALIFFILLGNVCYLAEKYLFKKNEVTDGN